MLSVRLPEAVERDLTQYCAVRKLTKSQVVQEALAEYMVAAKASSPNKPASEPDLSFWPLMTRSASSLASPKTAPAPMSGWR